MESHRDCQEGFPGQTCEWLDHFSPPSTAQDPDWSHLYKGDGGRYSSPVPSRVRKQGLANTQQIVSQQPTSIEYLLCAGQPGWQALPRFKGSGKKLCFLCFSLAHNPFSLKWHPGSSCQLASQCSSDCGPLQIPYARSCSCHSSHWECPPPVLGL